MRRLFEHRDDDNTLEEQLLNESGAMVKYASAAGRRIPPAAALTVSRLIIQRAEHGDGSANAGWRPSPDDSRDLAMAHYMLSRVVSPATPQSITVLNEERPTNRFWKLLGPVRLVRCLMVMAIVFLAAFIILLTIVDVRPIQELAASGNQRPPEWWTRLWSGLYVLCAAALGAIFASLFRVNARIESGLYDPKEESSYTATIVLGMIAGVILAMVVSASLGGTEKLTQPLLALLGGFSAPAVHRILNRLVETLEALVRGSTPDQTATPVQRRTACRTSPTRGPCSPGRQSHEVAPRSGGRQRAGERAGGTSLSGRGHPSHTGGVTSPNLVATSAVRKAGPHPLGSELARAARRGCDEPGRTEGCVEGGGCHRGPQGLAQQVRDRALDGADLARPPTLHGHPLPS